MNLQVQNMRLFKPKYRDRTGKVRKTQKWYLEFRCHLRVIRRLAGFRDKAQTEAFGRQIERLIKSRVVGEQPTPELSRWLEQIPMKLRDRLGEIGLLDKSRVASARLLSDLVEDFRRSLIAKERSVKYVSETTNQVRQVFNGCGFKRWTDIRTESVADYLKAQRDRGISYRRSNALLNAVKMFSRWMVSTGYASESPVRHLAFLDPELDRRRVRRAATPDELRSLLETTIEGPTRYGMAGYERFLLYRLCTEAGLRAREARTLKVGSFDFTSLTVIVEAGNSKHRSRDVLPLRQELAAELRDFFAGKLPATKAFGGTYVRLTDKTADMIRADLEDAGVDYETDDGVLDFHSLRHTFITNLRNVPARVAQSLARHRSSAMTDRYTHVRLHDERAALDTLPDLSFPDRQSQRATGTDGRNVLASNRPFLDAVATGSNAPQCRDIPPDGVKNRVSNTPGRTRTCDLRIRNPLLCPAELRALLT